MQAGSLHSHGCCCGLLHYQLTPSWWVVFAATCSNADASARETGLNLAVATMRPGEQAHVYVTDPKYGYGEKGSFSFPSVPPSCQLVYEVEMITWEQPAEVRGHC